MMFIGIPIKKGDYVKSLEYDEYGELVDIRSNDSSGINIEATILCPDGGKIYCSYHQLELISKM